MSGVRVHSPVGIATHDHTLTRGRLAVDSDHTAARRVGLTALPLARELPTVRVLGLLDHTQIERSSEKAQCRKTFKSLLLAEFSLGMCCWIADHQLGALREFLEPGREWLQPGTHALDCTIVVLAWPTQLGLPRLRRSSRKHLLPERRSIYVHAIQFRAPVKGQGFRRFPDGDPIVMGSPVRGCRCGSVR